MRLSERNSPGSHIHMPTEPEWMGEVVFWGQRMQFDGSGAAWVGEKVLVAQEVHVNASSNENEPAVHGMHAEILEAPFTSDAVPAGHLRHVCDPLDVVAE
jgi:hypothetical protein